MSSLSQDDIDALASIGHDTVQTIVALVVEAIMYTLYFVLVVIAGRLLLRKRSKISATMFSIILIMFLLDTAMCILDVNNAIREITLTLTSTSPLSLSDRYDLTDSLPYDVTNSLFAYMICFGDVIIIWRAYTFWCYGKDRLMMILPALSLLGTFVTASVVSFCVAREVSENAPDNLVNPPFCHNVQQAMYCMTLVTTALATALICYKTWLYRKDISKSLSGSNKKTRTEKVMLVLIESGLLYFLLSLEFVVGDIQKVSDAESSRYNLAFADTIWTYMTSHILGMYPALMVILVNSQRSYLDQTIISTHIETTHMGSTRLGSTTAYTNSTAGSRKNLSTLRTGHTTTHTIEIDVHETHEMDGVPRRTATLPGSIADESIEAKDVDKPNSIV